MKNGGAINWRKKLGLTLSEEEFKPMTDEEIDALAAETVLKRWEEANQRWEESDRKLRDAISQVAREIAPS